MKLKDLITEKSDKIQIPGVGVSSYENLKRNVNKKSHSGCIVRIYLLY